ncbi:MAG TPA: hypothetical protein VFJ91_05330 [Gaiellaceae bacterium]|nr:hypothetical protein [Gaiellaceae bacterium]
MSAHVAPAAATRTRLRPLLGAGALVGVALAAANGLNAAYQLVLAHLLDPGEYSLLASLLTAVFVLTVPAVALQASVARRVAQRLAAGNEAGAGAALTGTLAGLARLVAASLVVAGIAAWPTVRLLHVERPLALVGALAALVAAVAVPVAWGGLQGARRFADLALSQVGYGVLRLALGCGLALLGAGVAALMFGVAAAAAVTLVAALVPLRGILRGAAGREHGIVTLGNLDAAAALSLFTALTSVDLLVARASFRPALAGAYAAASIGSRLLLLIPTAVVTVFFPRVAALGAGAAARVHLRAAVAAAGVLGGLAAAVLLLASAPLLRLGFGHDYVRAQDWLGPLAFAQALFGIVNVVVFHLLSLDRRGVSLLLAPAFAVQLALFAALHARPAELVGVQLGVAAGLAVAALVFERVRG